MGYIRTRANGQLAFVFSWRGKKHTKGLGTTAEQAAEHIRQDANEQLDRIRKGESALASKLIVRFDGVTKKFKRFVHPTKPKC